MRAALLLALSASVAVGDPARDAAWRQDLNTLATQLPRLRLNFSSSVSPADFSAAVGQLNDAIPNMPDAEIVTGMARIVALLNDPHTSLLLPQSVVPMRRVPLRLQWFSDGLFVTAASADYSKAVGAQVVGIGSMTTDQAYRAVAAAISHENDEWLRYLSPSYLNNADVLAALRVIPAPASAHFEFRSLAGDRFGLDLAATLSLSTTVTAPDPASSFTPLYRRNTSQFYWSTWLPSTGTLYFKYNSCQNMSGYPFTQFAADLLRAFDANPVQTFVVDLRGNTGGDSSVINPLLNGIGQRAARFRGGVTMPVLMDEGTISSGLLNAESFKGLGYATLYGAPTGGTPNHYGNVQSLILPNSRLQINYSTSFFSYPIATDALHPDVAVPLASADYFARFDPVLASIGIPTPPASPASDLAVVNAATLRAGTPVAPGSIAAVFGDFGPVQSADATAVPWPNQLGSLGVTVNGTAAPLLAVRQGQINLQIPAATQAGYADMRVSRDGTEVAKGTFAVTPAAPGIFIASASDPSRPGAILNPDYSLNTQSSAARRGDIVQFYGTGQGAADTPATTVFFGTEPAEVLYSGAAPGLPGVWQVNVRVPDQPSTTGQMPVWAQQGAAISNAVTLWIAK